MNFEISLFVSRESIFGSIVYGTGWSKAFLGANIVFPCKKDGLIIRGSRPPRCYATVTNFHLLLNHFEVFYFLEFFIFFPPLLQIKKDISQVFRCNFFLFIFGFIAKYFIRSLALQFIILNHKLLLKTKIS